MRNEKFSYLIRIVAGVYLIRLAVRMVQEGILDAEAGGNFFGGILACVLFIGAAGFFIISSIINMIKMVKEQAAEGKRQEMATEEVVEEPEPEETIVEEPEVIEEAETDEAVEPMEETEKEES